MEKIEKVVWGIVGAGDVCERKSAPAMYKTPFSEVKTVMRRNAEKAADFAKRHGINNWTTDINDLLNDPEINAIYIATPPDSHAELTLKAAKAGKVVYVEKPMANSVAECELMIQACRDANVPLFVAYYRRTLQGFLKVKELIENGTLGKIRAVNIEMYKPISDSDLRNAETNWRVDPDISGGGYFHDLASHQLDYLDFLFGNITQVKGISANQAGLYKSDDIVTATFRFENGVVGSGIWCFTADKSSEKDSIRIIGSQGELSFNCFGDPMTIHVKSSISGEQTLNYLHEQPIQQHLVQTIVNELRGVGISPSTGISGARTTVVMEVITHKNELS
jgi:predicted dehydrogenase